jgi:hypothetical protein
MTDTLAPLNVTQARIVGCLIEKAATTPEAYPLTLNAVVTACNQKTSREPILELEPGAVGHALRELEDLGLVRVISGARALRYEHRFDEFYTVTARQRALLCLLLLRGAQTAGELHTRCERLATFLSADELRDTLDRLCTREPPLVVRIGRGPGQREDRYAHLLSGADAAQDAGRRSVAAGEPSRALPGEQDILLDRIAALEARVEELEARLRG